MSEPNKTSTRLIGRRVELSVFEEICSDDHVVITEISGDPGIGKTRLLEAYAEAALRRGFRWISTQAQAADQDVPLAVFVDALEEGATDPPAAGQPVSEEEHDPELRQLYPAARQFLADARLGTAPGQVAEDKDAIAVHRLHRALRNLLEKAGRQTPLILAIDNVHAADPASVDLMVLLARRPPRVGVKLLLTYRHRQLPVRLAAALLQAQRSGTSRRVELGPLDHAEAAVLLGADASPSRLESIYDLAEGNPLYLQALRDANGRDVAQVRHGPPGDVELPCSVIVPLLMEVEGLDEMPRRVAHAAAISGDPVDPSLVAAACDTDVDTVLTALDELQERDLVRPVAERSRTLVFRHPLVRQVIYHAAPAGWRMAAHHRLATELSRQGASVIQRAPHVDASAIPGDDEAIELLATAADSVLTTTPALAAQWCRTALELMIDAKDQRRTDLLFRLGAALGMTGQHEGSRAAAFDLLRSLPAGDPRRPRAVQMYSAGSRSLGSGQDAVQLLVDELGEQPADSPHWADLKLELAHVDLALSLHGSARSHARAMRRWAACHDDRRRLARGSSILAVVEALSGGISSARAELAAADAALRSVPDLTEPASVELFVELAAGNITVGQYRTAIDRVREGLCLVGETGQEYIRALLLSLLSEAELRLGRLGLADAHAHEALEAAQTSGNVRHRVLALAQLSSVATAAGDLGRASGLGREAVVLSSRIADPPMLMASRALAVAWLLTGRAHMGTALLLETHGGDLMGKLDVPSRPGIYWALSRGSRLGGDTRRAAEWAGRASACAAHLDLPGVRGHAHLAMAEATIYTEPALALEHTRRAAAEFDSGGERLSVARAEHLAADVYQAIGDKAAARAAAGRAHGIYLSCGAYSTAVTLTELAAEAPQEPGGGADGVPATAGGASAGLGAVEEATWRGGPTFHDLSPRQRQVARLIAEGRSNRQIASVLHVVERTVEAHVSQILRRLGVDSRAAVATWVTRQMYRP